MIALRWPFLCATFGGAVGSAAVPLVRWASCPPKALSPTEGPIYNESLDLVHYFTGGTVVGNLLGMCVTVVRGGAWVGTLEGAGITAIVYSPLYALVLFGGERCIVSYKASATLAGGAAGVTMMLVGYALPATIAFDMSLGYGGYALAISWLGFMLWLTIHEKALSTMLPTYLDLGLLALAYLALTQGDATRPTYVTVYLIVTTLLVVPSVIYIGQVALNLHSAAPFLYDDKGHLLVPKPEPLYKPRQDDPEPLTNHITDRPPVTSPALPLSPDPPPLSFLAKTKHVFVVPNYGESVELLARTLGTLAAHPNSRQRYGIYMAMEAHEAAWAEKYETLRAQFAPMFLWMGHNVHHLCVGEMAGKGSNLNSAIRHLMEQWTAAPADHTMLTVLDADLLIAPEYVHYVDWVWASDPQAAEVNIYTHMTPLIDNVDDVPLPIAQWDLAFFASMSGQITTSSDPRFPLATYTMRLTIAADINYWITGMAGIGEDQMTAMRAYVHYLQQGRRPTLVAIRVPYWCSTESGFGAKCRQQVRHYLGMQIMWYSWVNTVGLPFPQRVRTTWRASAPFITAVETPILLFSLNFLEVNTTRQAILKWCLGLSACGGVAFLSMLCIGNRVLALWGLSSTGNALSRRNCPDVSAVLGCLVVSFFCQLGCGVYAKLWLALAEFGVTSVTYQGARKVMEEERAIGGKDVEPELSDDETISQPRAEP